VAVRLRVYAKCIAGREDSAQQRVDVALNSSTNSAQTPVDDQTVPDTAGYATKAPDLIAAGQGPSSRRFRAEGEGFEPSRSLHP
jgi:hypothetical protein